MATFISQRDQAITDYSTLIYPNSVGAIDGQVHQDSGVGQLESVYQNLVGYDNYAYVIVRTGVDSSGAEANTSAQNGINLLAAYAQAKLLTPGGNALSATNRAAVLVFPGVYDLGSSNILADTSYVDLIGVGGVNDVIIRSNDANNSTIFQSADDIVFKGFTAVQLADTTSTFKAAYEPQAGSAWPLTVMQDVILSGNDTFTSYATPANVGYVYDGTFTNVKCVNTAASSWDGDIYGKWTDCECDAGGGWAVVAGSIQSSAIFTRCKTDGSGFGVIGNTHGGTYVDCSAGGGFGGAGSTITGSYTNCSANAGAGFGWGGLAQGAEFIGCIGVGNCFGSSDSASYYKDCNVTGRGFSSSDGQAVSLAGTYVGCSGGDYSFGGNQVDATGTKTLSGNFYNCTAGNYSFGGSLFPQVLAVRTLSGKFFGCIAGDFGFAGQGTIGTFGGAANSFVATLSGEFKDCRGGNGSFGVRKSVLSGTFDNCKAGTHSFGCGWESSSVSTMSGKFRHCVAGIYSFGVSALMQSTAEFYGCVAGNNSFGDSNNGGVDCASQFYNCVGGNVCWTYGSTSTAVYQNCSGGGGCFGYGSSTMTLAAKYIQCTAKDGSFGAIQGNDQSLTLSGLFVDCTAENNSFGFLSNSGSTGTLTITGKLMNCRAGTNSFGWATSGRLADLHPSALLDNCMAGAVSFFSLSSNLKRGELRRCRTYNYLTGTSGMLSDNGVLSGIMRDCIWEVTGAGLPALKIADGAKIYGGEYRTEATATKSIESSTGSPINAAIANIMADVALDPSITNVITSPNVIIDSDI